jgi:ribosomal protein S18 acetylase RimI-like enzyme
MGPNGAITRATRPEGGWMSEIDVIFELVSDRSTVSTIKKEIDDILIEISKKSMATTRKAEALAAYDKEQLIGGICFRYYGRSAVIDTFAIKEKYRRQGLGSKILKAAEQKMFDDDCHQIIVETMDYQAPDFYRHHNYQDVANIPKYFEGATRFILRKVLVNGAGQ